MKQLYTFTLALFFSITLLAQTNTELPTIPPMRQLHHELIIESLKKIDTLYSQSDSIGKQYKKERIIWI